MASKADLYAGITNTYRTRHYIVFQEIGLCDDEKKVRSCSASTSITVAR